MSKKPNLAKIRKVRRYEDGAMYLWAARNNITTNIIGKWQHAKVFEDNYHYYLEARAVLLGVDRMARVRRRRIERLRKKETKRHDLF